MVWWWMSLCHIYWRVLFTIHLRTLWTYLNNFDCFAPLLYIFNISFALSFTQLCLLCRLQYCVSYLFFVGSALSQVLLAMYYLYRADTFSKHLIIFYIFGSHNLEVHLDLLMNYALIVYLAYYTVHAYIFRLLGTMQ